MPDDNGKNGITRRNFMGRLAAGTGAVGVASTGLMSMVPGKKAHASQKKSDVDGFVDDNVSPIPPIDPPAMWDKEVDVVVVGGGGAGLTACNKAIENVDSVLVVEKFYNAGGSTREATVAICWGTKAQKRLGIEPDPAWLVDWSLKDSDYTVDPDLIAHLIPKAAECMDWIEDMGYWKWEVYYSEGVPFAHFPENTFKKTMMLRTQGVVTDTLYQEAVKRGVEFMFRTKTERLVRDGDRIVGIKVENQGRTLYIKAKKGVVLCAGGMSMNRDMLKEYMPFTYQGCASSYNMPGNTGDAIRMGFGAGSDIAGYNSVAVFDNSLPYFEEGYDWYRYLYNGDIQLARQPWLYVNKHGERFINEQKFGPGLSFTLLADEQMKQVGGRSYVIYDANYETDIHKFKDVQDFCEIPLLPDMPGMKEWAEDPETRDLCPADWRVAVKRALDLGMIKKADTIEELADQLEIDPKRLKKTVIKYNEYCAKGRDRQFRKAKQYLVPVKKAPFYGIKVGAQIVDTECGLKVNYDYQVIDKDRKPIPGLYAASHTAGGVVGENNVSSSMNVGDCCQAYATGYIAGESVAKLG
ncbi:MAG: FAD-dependent oxidoreductase [Deltaproteobacteria bacterium]|nr:FAD-dependent oxidoreductase [Deltaproteobacteria bacterium]